MRLVWLAWYICGVCLLLSLLASITSYHPDSRHLGVLLPPAFGIVAILAAGTAAGLGRLPLTHRAHHSKPLWVSLVVVAVSATLILMIAA